MTKITYSLSLPVSKSPGLDPSLPTLALVFADPMQGRFPLENAHPRHLQRAVGTRAHYKYNGVADRNDLLGAVLKARTAWPYALTLVHIGAEMAQEDVAALEKDLQKQNLTENIAFVSCKEKPALTQSMPSLSYKDLEQMKQISREEICAKRNQCPVEPSLSKRLTGVLYSFFG